MSREAWSAAVLPHARRSTVLARKLADAPLRAQRTEPPMAQRDATGVELAAVMARLHTPLAAAVDNGLLLGVATVGRLADRMLP